jgi:hypothetical protein
MFFAPAVAHWWGFATHPSISERIRRVHPRFAREGYRGRRAALEPAPQVAVLDGLGNLVKVLNAPALSGAAGERLRTAAGAAELVLGLARDPEALPRAQRLPAIEVALPRLKALPQSERDRLIAEVERAVEADGRVRLSEFVLLTFVRQHLRAGAGRPVSAHYRRVSEVAEPARVVLSLLVHAGGRHAGYAKAIAALGIEGGAPLPRAELGYRRVGEALEVLRALAPLAKPRLLQACVDCASDDGTVDLAGAELLRAVAATLDCPLPPRLA